ncbi:protein PALS2-like [Rhopilema esculentum]|uniref:protein PALS2-like n=1 Tax=Rhopilema esculentum TaxID=499914 RepID=UPI0031D522E9|eukprot:gene13667-4570_t
MPVPTEISTQDALKIIAKSLDVSGHADLFESERDVQFLKNVLSDATLGTLAEAYDVLENPREDEDERNNIELCKEILTNFDPLAHKDDRVNELFKIMEGPHFRSLVEAHDNILFRTYKPEATPAGSAATDQIIAKEPIVRIIGLCKTSSEPLGITLAVDDEMNVYIARILHGSLIDKQGLLHVGDVIKQVNGEKVKGDPDAILAILKNASGNITLHIIPSYRDNQGVCQIYVKTHFDYDATKDKEVPCNDVGLSFRKGDILAIVDQSDANWWQARTYEGGKTGLIPSQMLEESRRTQITPQHKSSRIIRCGGSRSKKRKMMYSAKKNAAFDRLNVPIYEEVAKMPPFERKTLVLIGAPRVGRRTLKNKLLTDTEVFGTTVPHTSRQKKAGEENGKGYIFVSRAEMQKDIDEGKFVEWGEYEEHLYGTKIDSIRNVMRTGKMCILDLNPTALKVLKTAEFMPYVVFVASPSFEFLKRRNTTSYSGKMFTDEELLETVEESQQLYDLYSHYFDLTIINEDFEKTYKKLRDSIQTLSTDAQWVPVNWVY